MSHLLDVILMENYGNLTELSLICDGEIIVEKHNSRISNAFAVYTLTIV